MIRHRAQAPRKVPARTPATATARAAVKTATAAAAAVLALAGCKPLATASAPAQDAPARARQHPRSPVRCTPSPPPGSRPFTASSGTPGTTST